MTLPVSIHGIPKSDVLASPKLPSTASTPTPIVYDIPYAGKEVLVLPESQLMIISCAIPIDVDDVHKLKGKLVVYNYETGKLLHTILSEHRIDSLKHIEGILYLQVGSRILAYDLQTFAAIELNNNDYINKVWFDKKAVIYTSLKYPRLPKDQHKTLDFFIVDAKTLQLPKTMRTDYFSMAEVIFEKEDLYLVGFDSNNTCGPNSGNSAFIAKYEKVFGDNPSLLKANFDINSIQDNSALRLDQGLIYFDRYMSGAAIIWCANTFNPLFEKNLQQINEIATIKSKDDYVIVSDSCEMEILKKSSGALISVKKIAWDNHDAATLIGIYASTNKPTDYKIIEGYKSGIVRIRHCDQENYKVFMELRPPGTMSDVLEFQLKGDKLLVQYKQPSDENVYAILWDLNEQKPSLLISWNFIQASNTMNFFQIIGNDIVMQKGNQLAIYRGVI